MRYVLFGFIVLLLSAFLGIELKEDPGYILISVHQWTIETSVWIALLVLILSFLLIHGLVFFFKTLFSLPQKIKYWKAQRRIHRAQMMTRKGLLEFSEGYWFSAQKHLIQALPYADSPLINYLTAARAAQELGENQRRDDFLREAQQSMPDTKIAVELTQAQLQLAQQQWEQALATLKHLQGIAPNHPHVLKLLLALYEEIKDWPQLIKLLPLVKRAAVLSAQSYEKVRLNAFRKALEDLIKSQQNEAIIHFFTKLPKDLKNDQEIMALYAEYFIKTQDYSRAENLLRQFLKKQFSDRIIRLYGQFFIGPQQLYFAESLMKKQPGSAELYLCLGRLCMANQLWGKAETYLSKSIALKPGSEAYTALGHYFFQFHQLDKACAVYKEALLCAAKE